MSLKDPNSRLTRWRLRLAEYDFDIKYKQGAINANADALSRVKINFNDNESILAEAGSTTREQSENNEETQTQHSQDNNVHPGIPIIQDAINKKQHQIYFRLHNRLDSIEVRNENGYEIIEVGLYTSKKKPTNALKKFVQQYMKPGIHYYGFFYVEELYQKMVKILTNQYGPKIRLTRCTEIVEIIMEKDKQIEIIKKHHEGVTNHRGITETLMHISRKYWWKNISNDRHSQLYKQLQYMQSR